MSPKTREPADRRDAILQAAQRLFAKNGPDKTRLEDVARLARVSKGSLYEVAGSKLELFLLVVREQFARELTRVEKTIAGIDDPVEAMAVAMRASLPSRREEPGAYAMIAELVAASIRDVEFGRRAQRDIFDLHVRAI